MTVVSIMIYFIGEIACNKKEKLWFCPRPSDTEVIFKLMNLNVLYSLPTMYILYTQLTVGVGRSLLPKRLNT
jgi:hypothetical protein